MNTSDNTSLGGKLSTRNLVLQLGELVSLPVKKEGAIEKPATHVNLCVGQPGHDQHDPSPRRMNSVCDACGPIIDTSVLVKGIKTGKSYIVLTQDEVAQAKESYANQYKGVLNIVAHPAQAFLEQTAPGDSLHYLTPASEATSGQYQTIVQFISDHPELVFVGLHTPVSVTDIYRLTARDGVLVMEKRVRSQALKPTPSVGGEPMQKLQMFLEMTLEDVLTDFDATAYEDGYRKALDVLAAEQGRVVAELGTDVPTVTAGVSDADLMTKLEALKGAA